MKLKLILLFLLIVLISCNGYDDESTANTDGQIGKIITSIDVNGVDRDYIIYIPQSYTVDESIPLILAFHGLGGSMNSSYENSNFDEIAERENFIVVHPNANASRWNAFGAENNTDIDFIRALINNLKENYNINTQRIFSCGMSNGGFFSFLLACEMSNDIAGIASVTGLMYPNVYANCQPSRAIPILQIHGTQDAIVPYENVGSTLSFWIDNNNTNTEPIETDLPDSNPIDGSTVKKYIYNQGTDDVEIHHFKIIGGRHTWPGYQGNMDINASEEIWNFFKQFDLNGKLD